MDERLTIEQGAIEKLKASFPELCLVETVLGDAVFRPPTSAEYQRFVDMVGDKHKAMAIEQLSRACCVYPDANTFREWCTRKSGIPSECANAITDMAGVTGKAVTRKL